MLPIDPGTKFVNDKGQIIGFLKGRVFTKKVERSKHHMQILDAWGIDAKTALSLRGRCDYVVVFDTETKVKYRAELAKFIAYNLVRNFGHGEQYFLPLKFWETKVLQPDLFTKLT